MGSYLVRDVRRIEQSSPERQKMRLIQFLKNENNWKNYFINESVALVMTKERGLNLSNNDACADFDFISNIRRNRLIMRELHSIGGAPLRG